MNESLAATAHEGSAPELPELARTASGIEFDPRACRWVYRDAITTVNLDFASWPTTESFMVSAKLTLLWYAKQMSASHLHNTHAQLTHYLRTICVVRDSPVNEITSTDLLNYRDKLTETNLWYFARLSGVLQKWSSLGFSGVTADAIALLRQLRTKNNRKGEAVLTHDPIYGPFTDMELESLLVSLDRAYAHREVDREGYLLAYLFILLGQRPVQYAALKVRDLVVTYARDGTPLYMLRVPRAKQRYQLTRAEFKDRVLIPQIGELLMEHSNEVRTAFKNLLLDALDAPLFPARLRRRSEPQGFEYHRTATALSLELKNVLREVRAKSERTGQPLHITALRFRRTVATRAAMEGHGELIIAELLDHTDTQSARVYIEARPELLERIDRAMALHLAPMAQAFAGVIIDEESQATRAGDPSSRICDPRLTPAMKPIGNCGKHGFCGFLAPIACYTCVNFQPWLDAPHEAVLDYLIQERDRLAAQGDLRIASVNDRTILAVAEVVRLCHGRRKGCGP